MTQFVGGRNENNKTEAVKAAARLKTKIDVSQKMWLTSKRINKHSSITAISAHLL